MRYGWLFVMGWACQPEPGSWDDFWAASTDQHGDEVIYRIEGDLRVTAEVLAQYYPAWRQAQLLAKSDIQISENAAVVNVVSGRDDIWDSVTRYRLRYCVSQEFGAEHARVVAELATATSQWEAHGGFDFIYDPTADGQCTPLNDAVLFAVRPFAGNGAVAFFPSSPREHRTLFINLSDWTSTPGLNSSVGGFRHELGHILGLRHEHIRVGRSCPEIQNWRAVTNIDYSSVMYYDECPGATHAFANPYQNITSLDAAGITQLYPPRCTQFSGCAGVVNYQAPPCQNSGAACRLIPYDALPNASNTTVLVTGAAAAGPATVSSACPGPPGAYVEVYRDDLGYTFSAPECVRYGDIFQVSAGSKYTFRGPSVVGPLGSLILTSLGAPAQLTAQALGANQVQLCWTDPWTAKLGVRVERARRAGFAPPTPVLPIGEFGYYWHYSMQTSLERSATRFCQERGYQKFESYQTQGPVGAAYSRWTGTGWATTGDNTVFVMTQLECATAWGEIGVALGGEVSSYLDSTAAPGTRYGYRVRSYGSTVASPYSAVMVVATP